MDGAHVMREVLQVLVSVALLGGDALQRLHLVERHIIAVLLCVLWAVAVKRLTTVERHILVCSALQSEESLSIF